MKRKLIKHKEGFPSWFPLKVYSEDLTPIQWLEELVARVALQHGHRVVPNNHANVIEGFRRTIVDRDRPTPVTGWLENVETWEALVVRPLSVYDAAYIGARLMQDERGVDVINGVVDQRNAGLFEGLEMRRSELFKKARSDAFDKVYPREVKARTAALLRGMPVIVDISLDDESLKVAFELWLHSVRDPINPIGEKDFEEWKRFGILPLFDLSFWGELNNIRYSETLVADYLWPNEDIHRAERLRKVTRVKMAEILGDYKYVTRLHTQLRIAKAIDNFAAQLQEEHTSNDNDI